MSCSKCLGQGHCFNAAEQEVGRVFYPLLVDIDVLLGVLLVGSCHGGADGVCQDVGP